MFKIFQFWNVDSFIIWIKTFIYYKHRNALLFKCFREMKKKIRRSKILKYRAVLTLCDLRININLYYRKRSGCRHHQHHYIGVWSRGRVQHSTYNVFFFSSLVCEVKERIVHIERIDVNWAERTRWNEQKSNKKKKKKKHTTINQQTNQQPHSRKKSEEEMKRNNKLMKFSTINLFCCVTMHT